jgi:hypothetical protein
MSKTLLTTWLRRRTISCTLTDEENLFVTYTTTKATNVLYVRAQKLFIRIVENITYFRDIRRKDNVVSLAICSSEGSKVRLNIQYSYVLKLFRAWETSRRVMCKKRLSCQ